MPETPHGGYVCAIQNLQPGWTGGKLPYYLQHLAAGARLKESSLSHYNAMNVLSMHALVGAYKPEGWEWLDELRQVLTGNVEFACRYIQDHFDGIEVSKPEGTYMLFLDCTKWCEKHGKTIDELQRAGVEVKVIWQDGRPFHGPCHIRMNLALPFSRVRGIRTVGPLRISCKITI